MKKKYLCFWGSSFVGITDKAKIEEHGLDNFSEGNGYDADDIKAINNLLIGAAWQSKDYIDHSVVRIE